ncbi:MAG: acetate kinase [Cyanobacteriota bacterium]|nr:acetate kinase [Cyanobacteriota bacterium]
MRGGCVLVVNAGSSSLKALLLDPHDQPLWRGQTPWTPHHSASGAPNPAEAALQGWLLPAIAPWSASLALVGHRVVHGGTAFTAPTRVTADVHRQLDALTPLAPLHNGPALAILEALLRWRPELPQWACFDTAFHHTLPPEAFTYAIPSRWREMGLRRYGFHGLSHQHVSERVPVSRLISCHLGAGCSLCAIRNGHSVATTMGFTPMEGLVMATRSGSVDPGLLLHLLRQGIAAEELDRELNHASGWLALSDGRSTDMRELREAAAAGDGLATLAIAVFRRRLLEGIGAMAASLGGVDAIALTGGIGEHDQALKEELREALAWMGPGELVVVRADEEGVIARLCRSAAEGAGEPAPPP